MTRASRPPLSPTHSADTGATRGHSDAWILHQSDGLRPRQVADPARLSAGADLPRPRAGVDFMRLCDRSGLLRSTALQAVACLVVAGASFAAVAQPAPTARPTGGQVVAGQASIAQTTARTTVNQSSQRGAVNWQSFDVGSQHTVQFQQPSANAVTLNRVVGPNPSEIAGRIQANGQVVVVNQAGVLFHRGAQVDTAGLVVSAAGISNNNFMAGRMVFDQPAKPGAKIENRGTITIREQGLAALVAPQVANSGVIRARMGKVILAGAEAHTLDLYGDGLLSINVTRQVQSNPGDAPALVTNTGTVSAAGGTVLLTAEAVDGVVSTLVNSGGRVSANTRAGQTGRVVLSGRGGDVIVAGTVTADGNRAGQTGGTISVTPTGHVTVASSARISASGQAGGGTVAIGVARARTPNGPPVADQKMAANITVQPGATIAADARVLGTGGNITLLSSGTTRMNGAISARGGSSRGDGGFVEVSGHRLSSVTGKITVSAPSGRAGSILLDPEFLDIVDASFGAGTWDTTVKNTGTVLAGAASIPPDTISNTALNDFEGNVLLQANQTITVAGNVSLTKQPNLSLTLEAGGTITVNAGIVLTASGDIILATGGAGPSSPPIAQASPLISVLGTVTSTGGNVSLLAGTGGTVGIDGAGLVSGSGVTLSSVSGGAIAIAGSVAATGAIDMSSGTIALNGAASVTGGTITLAGANGIALNDTALLGRAGAIVDLSAASGSILQAATGTLIADTLLGSGGATGDVRLLGGNKIANLGAFAVVKAGAGTGNFLMRNTAALTVTGTVSAGGDNLFLQSTDSGGVTVAGGGRLTAAGTVAVRAQTLRIDTGGGIDAPAFEFAPATIGNTATLGSALAGLQSLSGISATRITIGAVNDPASGPTTTAGTVAVAGTFDVGGRTLDLRSSGPITQSAPLTNVGTLVGSSAGSTSLTHVANAIGTIGTFSAGGGADFFLVDTGNLTVSGPLTAGRDIGLTVGGTGTIIATGGIGADRALTVTSGSGGIVLNNGAILTGATVTLVGGGGQIGLAAGSSLGKTGAVVDLSTSGGGVLQNAGGTIIAATLRSTSGVTGAVALNGSANRIAALGSFAITGDGNGLTLVDSTDLTIDGPVFAPGNIGVITGGTGRITVNAEIEADGVMVLFSGTGGMLLNAGTVLDSDRIGLIGTGGGLTMAAGAQVGRGGSLLDIRMDSGGVQQDPGAIIAMATLQSTGGVTGSVSLAGTANAIGQVQSFAVSGTGANFLLRDAGDLVVGNGVSATGNVTVIAGATGLLVTSGSIGAGGTLSLTSGDRGIFVTSNAILTGQTVAMTASGSLDIAASATLAATGGVVDLNTSAGGISQHADSVILAGTLISTSGVTGSVALRGTGNAIGAVGTFAVSGADADLSLTNTGNLAITGALTATRDITVTDNGGITAKGSIGAGRTLSLTATGGGIALEGTAALTGPTVALTAAGPITMALGAAIGQTGSTVDLATTSGGIAQDGGATITAATLRSTAGATGSVSLAGATNAIEAVTGFVVTGANADFRLIDTGNLVVSGTLTATRDVTLATGGTGKITSTGTIGAGRTLEVTAGSGGIALNGGAILTGPTLVLAGTGPISLAATAHLGQSGALVDISTTSGGIAQDAGATIVAATLLSTGGVVGSAAFAGVANAIGTVGAFAVSGAASDFALVNTGGMVVAGALTATRDIGLSTDPTGGITATGSIGAGRTLSLTAGSGGIVLDGGAIVTGPTLALASNAGITVSAGATLGQAAATLDLRTVAGDVIQAAGATIIAETLTSLSGIGGAVSLAGTANAIGTIGAFGVTGAGGGFLLRDSGHLVVAGKLTAFGDITLTTGTIQTTGSIGAGGTMALTATAGGIALDPAAILTGPTIVLSAAGQIALASGASLGQTGALLDLSTSAGGIDQNAGATITAATLRSGSGVTGAVSLTGTANAIGTLAAFAVSGAGNDFSLLNTGSLAVAGALTAPRDIRLESGVIRATGSIGAGRTASVTAVSGGIALDGGATVSAPTIIMAAAGSIVVASGAILGKLGGRLDIGTSAGGIVQDAGGTIVADTLVSSAGVTGSVALAGTANAVGTVAAFAVSGVNADFTLVDAGNLIIAGPLTATRDIRIGTGTIAVTGSIGAGGTLALNALAGIALNTGAVVTAPIINFAAAGPITLTAGAALGQPGATISLSTGSGGIDQNPGATITAATLLSPLGVTGSVSLAGTANAIGTVGAFALNGAGSDFFLLDTGNLTVAGPLTAPRDITLVNNAAGTIAATGSIGAGGALSVTSGTGGIALESAAIVTGPTITLDGGGGPIRLASGARLGQTGALLDVTTSGGGIDQNAGAVVTADLLRSSTGVTGSVSLAGTANAIGTLGVFEVAGAGNGFTLVDTLDLTIVGRLAAPLDIAVVSGTIATGGSIAAGRALSLTAQTAGIALDGAAVLTGTTITLAGAGALTMAPGATIGQAGAIVDLSTSTGGIEQDAGATIVAATLRSALGVTGNVVLPGVANDIGTLAAFAVSGAGGGFALRDTGPLLVSGPVTAPGTIAIATDGAIATSGSIGAGGTLTLTSDSAGIALNAGAIVTGPNMALLGGGGAISLAAGSRLGQAGASIALTANSGGIAQADGGTIVAGTLRGVAGGGGAVSLSGSANAIAMVTDFVAGGAFSLVDAAALTVSGPISATDIAVQAAAADLAGQLLANAGAVTVTTTSGALTQSGRIAAVTVASLTSASGILHTGTTTVSDPDGAVRLVATSGDVRQSGTVTSPFGVAFTAQGGSILHDGATTAGIGGVVIFASGDITQSGGSIGATEGSITLTAGGSITQSAGTMAVSGTFTGLAISLIANGTEADDGIFQSAAGTMSATTGLGAAVQLEALHDIGVAGRIEVTGSISSVTLAAATGSLTQSGTVSATTFTNLRAGAGLTNDGRIDAGVDTTLTAGTNLLNTGTVTAGTQASVGAGANLTNAGTITAGTTAAVTAGADLTNTGTITGGDLAFPMATTGTLTQDGIVTGGNSVWLFARSGPLVHGGTTTAGSRGATIDAGTDIIQTGGTIQASGDAISMNAGRSIRQISGLIQMQSPVAIPIAFPNSVPAIYLKASGTGAADGIIQSSGGTIVASPGIAFFTASNRIDLAGRVSAAEAQDGIIFLHANGAGSTPGGSPALSLSGSITAGFRLSELVDRGDILHGAQASVGFGGVTIQADGGSFRQTGGAILTSGPSIAVRTPTGAIEQAAGTMAAASAIDLTAATGITQGGTLRIASGIANLTTTEGPLTQTGAISARKILFTDINGPVTVAGTLSGLAPSRLQSKTRFAIAQGNFPTAANDTGVFITAGSPGVDTSANHAITFNASASATSGQAQLVVTMVNNDPAVLNINATNVDLFMTLQTGPASGTVFVSSLHLGYPQPGTSGEVALEGTVNGLTGQDTAPGSFIQPLLKSNYTINGCAIQAISCVLITTSRLPVDNPLKNVQTGQNRSLSDVFVILPDVAERDY